MIGIRPAFALPLAAWLWAGSASGVDGTLPSAPYRYLHPPTGSKGKKVPPTSAVRVIPPEYARSVSWNTFTPDSQAGIAVHRAAVDASPHATGIVVRITPVDAPPGLPRNLALDGNAYRIDVREEPSERTVRFRQPALVALRWPYSPVGIYRYRSGRWARVCLGARAAITSSGISCPTRTLGIVAAVTLTTSIPSPPAAAPSPFSQLPPSLWLLVGVSLLIAGGAVVAWAARNSVKRGA